MFDAAEREAAVENETAALSAAIGDPGTNSAGESMLAIFECFLVLHLKGEHSVCPSAGAVAGITQHVVADFFNTIGHVAEAG